MEALKRELKKVGSLSIFFFIGFGYILILFKLVLEEYSIDAFVLSKAIIYALVAAKSVAILDMTPWINHFSDSPRYRRVLYKTLIYTSGVLVLGFIENLFHSFHEAKAIGPAIALFIETRDFHRFMATVLCVSIVFLIHNIFQELDHYLGKGNLSKFFFKPPS